jgi:hypothetical protein
MTLQDSRQTAPREERVVGYAFFLVGILLAIVDAVRRARKGHRPV